MAGSSRLSEVVRSPLLLRLAPAPAGRSTPLRAELHTHALFAAVGLAPALALPIAILAGHGGCPRINVLWLFDYAVLNYAQLVFARAVWRLFVDKLDDIDSAIHGVPAGAHTALLTWVRRATMSWPQIAAIAAGALLGAASAAVLILASDGRISRCPATDVTAVWTGAIAGHSAYWIACGTLLCLKVASLPQLTITWPAPINTPALVTLNDCAERAARLGSVLFVITQVPLVAFYFLYPTPQMSAVYIGTLVVTAGFVTIVGLLVPMRLSRRARAEKLARLTDLAADIEATRSTLGRLGVNGIRYLRTLYVLKSKVEIYRALDSSASSYVDLAVMAQYGGIIIPVASQIVLALALGGNAL